jgi:hypothetical protein
MSDLIKDPKLISAMQELGRGLKSPSGQMRTEPNTAYLRKNTL